MTNPALLVVGDDRTELATLELELAGRYGGGHRVVSACGADAAMDVLRSLREHGSTLALVVADGAASVTSAIALLAAARDLFPGVARVLMTSHEHAEEAMLAVNEIGVDRYLVKPWEPAEGRLHPILEELLADWHERASLADTQVRSVMTADVAAIDERATLRDAAAVVARTGAGDVMVVGSRGAFLGVLSEGDILRNALPDLDEILRAGGTLHDAYQLFAAKARELAARSIIPLVIRDPLVLHPDDHVAKAAIVLIDRQIGRLPVVEDHRLVGTLSRADICRAVIGPS